MSTRLFHVILRTTLAVAIILSGFNAFAETPKGLWLFPRKDAGNSARADVPGRMKIAPHEIWSFGGNSDTFSFCQPVWISGKPYYFGQVRTGVRLVDKRSRIVWQNARLGASSILGVGGFLNNGRTQAMIALGGTSIVLIDIANGKTLWTFTAPTGTYLNSYKLLWRKGDSRFICFIQNSLQGVCFRLPGKDGKPELLWERTYTGAYLQGYGPQIVLADMDNDGTPEVVVTGKPGYAGVVDLDTGAMKHDLHYKVTDGPDIGRPYGLLTVVDIDNDGYRDIIMVSCQVEEYIAVLRNLKGKGLSHIWSQFIEKDYPEDHYELRPNIASIADVNGDGKPELVLGFFNTTGDGKWHTVVIDPLKGYKTRLLDLPNRYFWGCYDLTGDGRSEIITSTESVRLTAPSSTIQAVDAKTGRDLVSVPSAHLTTESGPLENNSGFLALRATPVFIVKAGHSGGLLIRRQNGKGKEEIWSIAGDKSAFVPFKAATGARAVLLSRPEHSLANVDLAFRGTTSPGGPDAANPRVSIASGQRELVLALSDGTVIGGSPDWSKPGRFHKSWTMPGCYTSIWIGPSAERVVCTQGPLPDEVHIGKPTFQTTGLSPTTQIRTPYPVYTNQYTSSGITLVPFGDTTMQLFVGLQTGVHTLACAMFDATGKQIWLNSNTGPYPRSVAVAKLEPNGPYTLIVNDHYDKTIYNLDGQPKLNLPYGASRIGGVVNSAYALPIVGPYGPNGETRIFLTPGLSTVQALDANAAILSTKSFDTYEFEYCGSSVARLQTGAWDLGMINHDGIFHCLDLQKGESRWTMDLGVKASYPMNISTADIDGDGRDNFLVGLPNGKLLALDEKDGKGFILWQIRFDAGVRDAFAADLNGDGYAEIIVQTEDGRVWVLGTQPKSTRRH